MVKKKILIVDDEFAINYLLEMTLEKSYELVVAKDGEEALEKMSEEPDLVILDIMMPRIDGFEVLQSIRSNLNTLQTPVMILSAKHEPEDIEKARRYGIVDYVLKPFEPDLLKKKIDAFFRERPKGDI